MASQEQARAGATSQSSEKGEPAGAGAGAQATPSDPCAEPWRFDASGKVLTVPAECALFELDRGDPPPDQAAPEQHEQEHSIH